MRESGSDSTVVRASSRQAREQVMQRLEVQSAELSPTGLLLVPQQTNLLLWGIWQTLEDINEALRERRNSPGDRLLEHITEQALDQMGQPLQTPYRPGEAL